MTLFSAIHLAVVSLLVNKGRSALTSLGIVIGSAAVIALVSAGSGAWHKLDERLESAGKNLIIVRPGARTGTGIADFAPLTEEDAEAIRREARPALLGAVPWQMAAFAASTPTGRCTTVVSGSTPEFQRVCNWQVVQGRLYTTDDVRKSTAVCLIGQTVRRKLFVGKPNPVGEKIRVGPLPVRVIGVMGEKGQTPLGVDQDDQIFMPLSTLQRKLVGKEHIAMLLAAARSEADIDPAKGAVIQVLRQQHRIRPGVGDDFDVSSVRELAEFAVVLATTLQVLTAVIASLSLVVGGIGIMNIMLVAVTERTHEIGIRLAVGATPGHVLTQFLLEAVVLALAGGILGVTLGITGALSLAHLASWPAVVSPANVALSLLITAGVGVFFGSYPAWKASRLTPVQALHYD
jgi:putative ABC transport system permease protein